MTQETPTIWRDADGFGERAVHGFFGGPVGPRGLVMTPLTMRPAMPHEGTGNVITAQASYHMSLEVAREAHRWLGDQIAACEALEPVPGT